MRGFLSVVLRIIMLLAFVGIIVFVAVAIITNQSIAYSSYNYIYSEKQKANFSDFYDNLGRVKETFGASKDEYTAFLSNAILDVNNGVDYYLSFLSKGKDLTKGDHDRLINDYKKYISSYETSRKLYNDYKTAYTIAEETNKSGNEQDFIFAKQNLEAKEKDLVLRLVEQENTGINFFRSLVNVVDKYVLKTHLNTSYKGEVYILNLGLANLVVKDAFYEGNNFRETRKNILLSEDYATYKTFRASSVSISDKDLITNGILRQFVEDLSYLDGYLWASDYDNYVLKIDNTMKEKAIRARLNFGELFV